MHLLANPYLSFTFDPNTARWSLRPANRELPALLNVRSGLTLRDAQNKQLKWTGAVRGLHVAEPVRLPSLHGPLTALTAVIVPETQAPLAGLFAAPIEFRLVLEFALPETRPFLLWRLTVENAGPEPFFLRDLDLAVVGSRFGFSLQSSISTPSSPASHLHLHPNPGPLAFFSNGYQSWSFTGANRAGMRRPLTKFRLFDGPKFYNLRNPVVDSLGHFTSDMFAVLGDPEHNVALVAGFLAQREQFGHIETLLIDSRSPYLRLTAHGDDVPVPPGSTRSTDWAYVQFIEPQADDPLAEYLEAVARENAARVPERTPVGWCSWYHYYDRVTEQDIVQNLAAIARERERLPLDFVQLDDGFQAQVGDWFETKPTFPHGLRWLSEQIRAHGSTPGLWLAPYIVRSDARLNAQHPDWFLRNRRGWRVNAGLNWFRWCYALDPTHPGVREHTQRLIETAVKTWGFPYLKLDFLYAAALPGRRYDPTLTRAQAMRLALQDIRDAAGPETFLLGCGCPLGPAIGLVDGMRISTDVAPNWNPELFSPMLNRWLETELGFVSARNAVQNIISRAPLHRRWWLNDPDCLLVRDEATKLTEAEVRCLATVIALSGGMLLVSDDMTRLRPERYRYIQALLPVLSNVLRSTMGARARDWLSEQTPETLTLKLNGPIGEWLLAGVFNWQGVTVSRTVEPAELGLPPGAYWVADFWDETVCVLETGQALHFDAIPAHGVHLVALRPRTERPTFVSSTFHFSQGGEVTEWVVNRRTLRFKIGLGRVAEGEVRLALPAPPCEARANGAPVTVRAEGAGLYRLSLTVHGSAQVFVEWSEPESAFRD